MAPLAALPTSREGWIRLLKTALSSDLIPIGSFKSPLHFYPRLAKDGRIITNWGHPPPQKPKLSSSESTKEKILASGQERGSSSSNSSQSSERQSAVLMLLTPVETTPKDTHNTRVSEEGPSTGGTHTAHPRIVVVDDLVFTLTMRTGSMRSHSSQMAFPGGRSDKVITAEGHSRFGQRIQKHEEAALLLKGSPEEVGARPGEKREECSQQSIEGDKGTGKGEGEGEGGFVNKEEEGLAWEWETPEDTACREAFEEVGVPKDSYTIVGRLRPLYSTPSKSWVTPVVAIANPSAAGLAGDGSSSMPSPLPPSVRPFVASPAEVESIHYLSLSSLLANSASTHHHNIRYYPFTAAMERAGGLLKTEARGKVPRSLSVNSSTNGADANTSTTRANDTSHSIRNNGALTGFVLPCFFAQDADPFANRSTDVPVVISQLYTGANSLPKGFTKAEREAKEQQRLEDGLVSAEVSSSHRTEVVAVGTPQGCVRLPTPNTFEEKEMANKQESASLMIVKGRERDGDDASSLCIVTYEKELEYVHESDAEDFTLVWGLTAFMLCELIARLTAARVLLSGSWGQKLTRTHPVDLAPMLSCSEIIVRDTAHPYGPEVKTLTDTADNGVFVADVAKSQL